MKIFKLNIRKRQNAAIAEAEKIFSEGRPGTSGANIWQRYRSLLKIFFCRRLNNLKIPGFVRSMEYKDELTGQYIRIEVQVLFTRISINGRDYYFRRLSGRFDGTGMGCSRR